MPGFKTLKFLLLLISTTYFSQNNIKGFVTNENSDPIPNAQIILKSGTKVIRYVATDKLGYYAMSYEEVGQNLTVTCFALNYLKEEVPIKKSQGSIEVNFRLVKTERVLKELEITVPKKIVVKLDTIILDVKSFAAGNEKNIGDLLKKLPGMEVDKEGIIRVEGKEIEKIMIDNDDFLGKGYKIISNNFPVNPVSKVEIIRNYSENKLLKGIESSDKIALNLRLNEDAKYVWLYNFDLESSLAPEARYNATSNIYSFGKKNKYYFATNINSFNKDVATNIEIILNPNQTMEAGIIGDEYTIEESVSIDKPNIDLNHERKNFSETYFNSSNAIFNPTKKVKIKVSTIWKKSRNNYYQNLEEKILVDNSFLTNEMESNLTSLQNFVHTTLDINNSLTKNAELAFKTRISTGNLEEINSLKFNYKPLHENLNNKHTNFDQTVKYTQKIGERAALVVGGRWKNQKSHQIYAVQNRYNPENSAVKSIQNSLQGIENNLQYAGITAQLLGKTKNGDSYDVVTNHQFSQNDYVSSLAFYKNPDVKTDISINDLRYIKNYSEVKIKYKKKWKEFNFLSGINFNLLTQTAHFEDRNKNLEKFFLTPLIGTSYTHFPHKASLIFTQNVQTVPLNYILPEIVNTSFRLMQKGIGELDIQKVSTYLLSYNFGDWSSQFLINSFIQFSKFDKSVANQIFVSPEKIIKSTYISLPNTEKQAGLAFDYFFKKIKSGIKLNNYFSHSTYFSTLNNFPEQKIRNQRFNTELQIVSVFKGKFNYSLNFKYENNVLRSDFINSKFNKYISTVDLLYKFNDNTSLNMIGERYDFKGNLNTLNTSYFVDFKFEFTIHTIPLSFNGYNITNSNRFQDIIVTDIYTRNNSYRLPGRFFSLGTNFEF